MSIVAATAVNLKVVQSVQVSVAAISASTYNAAGAPTVLSVDNTAAANQLTFFRDQFGRIRAGRKDAGGVFATPPKVMRSASQLFETLLEGLSTGAGEVGDKDVG